MDLPHLTKWHDLFPISKYTESTLFPHIQNKERQKGKETTTRSTQDMWLKSKKVYKKKKGETLSINISKGEKRLIKKGKVNANSYLNKCVPNNFMNSVWHEALRNYERIHLIYLYLSYYNL